MRRLLPPTLAAVLAILAVPLGTFVPGSSRIPLPWRVAGIAVIVVGALMTRSAHRLFLQQGAHLDTFGEPNALLTAGPFAATRNPMYLGITVVLVGVALLIGSATAAAAPAFFGLAADRWYIPFEEQRMRARFGEEYDEYRRRVPRWLGWPKPSGGRRR